VWWPGGVWFVQCNLGKACAVPLLMCVLEIVRHQISLVEVHLFYEVWLFRGPMVKGHLEFCT
jgi:hypothetical protein